MSQPAANPNPHVNGKMNEQGEWRPNETISLPPLFTKPFSWESLKWFTHRNFMGFGPYLLTAMAVYFWLQPGPDHFKSLDWTVIGYMYLRNVVFMLVRFGGWHFLLYTKKLNGSRNKYQSKWQNVGQSQFLFKNQTYDNMFYSLVPGAGIWTLYEVAYYWCWAHGFLPPILNFKEYPLFFILQLLLIPFWRAFHFYWVHRLIHWKPLYLKIHALHHKNVNIAPWSGMAMHPVEHIIYISCVLIHWIIPSHPIHFFYNMILTTITPASAHSGFQGEVLNGKTSTGDLTHYLHHRYFHYNFGDVNGLPLDKWFGTLHDGSENFEVKLPYEIKESKAHEEQNQLAEGNLSSNSSGKKSQKVKRIDENGVAYKIWQCTLCAFIYDEALGLPEEGIAAGTRWQDIPEDWVCPDCGLAKSGFDMMEIDPESSNQGILKLAGKKHIVIIGSGLAGYNLAREIRKQNNSHAITILTRENGIHYSKPSLSVALSAKKSIKDLSLQQPQELAEELHVNIRIGASVLAIHRQDQLIITDTGSIKYDKLVFATGASPIKPKLEGNGVDDILSVNNLEDFERLQKALGSSASSGKNVVLLGGGLIGCEFANDLATAGHQVHMVEAKSHPLPQLAPEVIGKELQNALESKGVACHTQTKVNTVDKVGNKLICRLEGKPPLGTDLIISAIGLAPQLQTGTIMRTSGPSGDCGG